jgi:hypothetical protein
VDSEAAQTGFTGPSVGLCRGFWTVAHAAVPVRLPLSAPRSNSADVTASGVIQQAALGESRDRIHARPVVDADDPFRCPAAAADTSALCDQASRTSVSPLPTKGLAGL